MVNDIIKLLGEKYRMALHFDDTIMKNVLKVGDKHDRTVIRTFTPLQTELANHDMLLCLIEQCILELQQLEK